MYNGIHHLCLLLFSCSDGYTGGRCEVEIHHTPVMATTAKTSEEDSALEVAVRVAVGVGGAIGGLVIVAAVITVIIILLKKE